MRFLLKGEATFQVGIQEEMPLVAAANMVVFVTYVDGSVMDNAGIRVWVELRQYIVHFDES